jgi:hypothetical protein
VILSIVRRPLHAGGEPVPPPEWRQAERYLAQVLLVLLGYRHVVRAGATLGEIAALLTVPLWIGAFRRFRGGVSFAVLGLFTVFWGLLLASFNATDHPISGSQRVQQSVAMLGFVIGVGVVLWARTLLKPAQIGLLFGFGMLIDALTDHSGWQDNPWKYSLAVPVSVIVLGAAMLGSTLVQVAGLIALAVVSVALDSRSYSAALALTGVLLIWRAARSKSVTGLTRLRIAALIGAVGLATYLLATSLLVNGYLGRDAQARSIEQIQASGSLILGGRPELAATIALMKNHIAGYGAGVVPTPNDILVAKAGLAGINYAPNNGYVERYMFGDQFELHSVFGDMWARWGLAGLALALLIALVVLRALVETVSGRTGDVLTAFAAVWTIWNLGFSPLFAALPVLVLAVGLGLVPRRQAVRPDAAESAEPAEGQVGLEPAEPILQPEVHV